MVDVPGSEARVVPPAVAFVQVAQAAHRTGQKAAAERGVGHKRGAEFGAHRQQFLFCEAGPQRVFSLER